jgi:archaellum component FlaC
MDSKDAYIQRFQAQLDEWKNDLERLRIKADQADAEARIEYQKQVDELEARRQEMRKQAEKVMQASEDSWKDMKQTADNAWREFDNAFKRAMDRFK